MSGISSASITIVCPSVSRAHPMPASSSLESHLRDAAVAELVDALGLGPSGVTRGGSNPFGRTSGGTASATSARSAGEQRFLIWKSNCPNLYLDDEPYRTLLDFALTPCRTVAAAGHDAIACRSPSPEPNAQIGRLCITAAGELTPRSKRKIGTSWALFDHLIE